jgi:hypothetical protein
MGIRALVRPWPIEIRQYRADFKEGIRRYFTGYFLFQTARKFIKSLRGIAEDLDHFHTALMKRRSLLSEHTQAIEKVHKNLKSSMELARQIHGALTREDKSIIEALKDRELLCRKNNIQYQLGPEMKQITKSFKEIRSEMHNLRKLFWAEDRRILV